MAVCVQGHGGREGLSGQFGIALIHAAEARQDEGGQGQTGQGEGDPAEPTGMYVICRGVARARPGMVNSSRRCQRIRPGRQNPSNSLQAGVGRRGALTLATGQVQRSTSEWAAPQPVMVRKIPR